MSMISEKLQLLPDRPGCYLMRDKNGTIIYVGKAKNLKNRVKSYFIGAHNAKTTLLVSEIVDFEYIITSSELEALVLEINLIKQHLPKYNIRLVDDKSYPYIMLTNEKHPRLVVTRGVGSKKKGRYFGPYPNVTSARKTVKLLNMLYPFRKCFIMPKKECLYYHMHQCLGPCIKKIDYTYETEIAKVTSFLKGDRKEITELLEQKMYEAAEKMEYEKAKDYRDLLADIKTTTEKQKIVLNDFISRDIIGVYANDESVSFEILYMRDGSIVQNYKTIIPFVGSVEDTVLNFLAQFYEENSVRPKEILINSIIESEMLEEFLGIRVMIPVKGSKKELVELAVLNAKNNLENQFLIHQNKVLKKQENIYQLGELLGINPPIVMEAFDNSNIMGEFPVSAMVVYRNGVKSPKEYRKYNVKSVVGANDYETMKEVIYRRYFRLLMEDGEMPDLIIMDGGLIQVNAAEEILNSLNINIPVMGLKKDSSHTTNVIVFDGQDIVLSKNSDLYLFLANVQQTVHNFAISFFRKSKAKGMFSSRLDGISGLGPKKKERLLSKYITIDAIRSLTIEEFKEAGIHEELAHRILIHLDDSKEKEIGKKEI